MKRFISVLALLMCLILLAACGVEDVLGEFAGQLAEADAGDTPEVDTDDGDTGLVAAIEEFFGVADDTSSDAVMEPWPNEPIPASDTDANTPEDDNRDEQAQDAPDEEAPAPDNGDGQPVDYTTLSAEECVEDAWMEPNVLPRITVDCAGARTINDQIWAQFSGLADDPMCDVYYEVFKGTDRVLSILMVKRINDSSYYTPFNLDLATGVALSGAELLELIGQDETELRELETALLGQEFTYQYGGMESEDGEFYAQQYARTTDPDNADTQRVWLGYGGELYFAGRIYGLAGAEYYEYRIPTGLFFGS